MPQPAIIFDSDGVVLDTERIARRATALALRQMGAPYKPHDYHLFAGLTDAVLVEKAEAHYRVALNPEEFPRLSMRHYAEIAKQAPPTPMPGIPEFLRQLDAARIPRAMATSASEAQIRLNYGHLPDLLDLFCAIVSAKDVDHGKPDPEVFLKAAAAIHADPSQCLVIEDAPAGIAAAHAAGCRVAAVATTFEPQQLTEADIVLPGTSRLSIPLLRALIYP